MGLIDTSQFGQSGKMSIPSGSLYSRIGFSKMAVFLYRSNVDAVTWKLAADADEDARCTANREQRYGEKK